MKSSYTTSMLRTARRGRWWRRRTLMVRSEPLHSCFLTLSMSSQPCPSFRSASE
jgi:hypothetical protein